MMKPPFPLNLSKTHLENLAAEKRCRWIGTSGSGDGRTSSRDGILQTTSVKQPTAEGLPVLIRPEQDLTARKFA
jgi:hypothetical protein